MSQASLTEHRFSRPGRKPRSSSDVILNGLVKDGLLPFAFRASLWEAAALSHFLRDLHAGWGSSGALAAMDLTRTHVSGGARRYSSQRICSDAMLRAERVLDQLQDHERGLLKWLEQSRPRINVTLSLLGKEWCHAVDDRDAAQRATGVLQALARSIAEHYPYHHLAAASQRPKRPPRAA